MSTFISLGSRLASKATGQVASDNTGNNTGKWTVSFDPLALNFTMPYVEVCHIVIKGAPGSSFDIFIDSQQWDTNLNGTANSWDPSVPMPIRPGQYLYFYWSDLATDGHPPTVTVWLRYDVDIPANRQALLGYSAGQLWVGHHRNSLR